MRRYSRVAKFICTGLSVAGAAAIGPNALADPASGSAYFNDPQSSHVEDATSRGIGTVNMIACIMSSMRPDALVNQGNYLALVDEGKCDPNRRSSTSNSSGSGAQAPSYLTAVVNSARISNTDPMLVKTWIGLEEEGNAMTIFVRTSASQAPSESNPYGVFRLDFCGKPDVGGGTTCAMNGYVDAQTGSLSFFQSEQQQTRSSTTALTLSSIGTTTGSGKLSINETDNGPSQAQEFAFAYNQSHFLRGNQCFARDAADPQTGFSVWRYGLYDAISGDRINRNSGFPVDYVNAGTTYHGYIGYWGLHLPGEAGTPANGATVNRVEYNSGSSPTITPYTLVKSSGKLTKYTRKSTTLDKLDKIRINTFVGSNVSGFFTGATPNTQYELYWDNTAGTFKVTGSINCGGNGCQTQDLANEQTVAVSFFASQGGLQGWSQSLGGELFVQLAGLTAPLTSTAVAVSYRVQDLVYPSNIPATLYCVSNCPTLASMTAYFAANSSAQSPFTGTTANNWNPTAAANVVTYTGDAANAVLRDANAAAVVFTDASVMRLQPQYLNGVRSGRLFTSLPAAECSTGSNTYCDYKVNEADVYYQWETGPNNYNQFAAVKDSNNNVVTFDAPLQVKYTVPTGAQYGAYASKTIVLQYGGFGDLWGIPGGCVSRLTNQPVSCETQDARYVPEFIIPMGATNGVVTDGNTNYFVKWLDREIRFASKPLSECASLTVPANVTLPTASGLQNTSDPNSSAFIGVKPTVTGAPRVIHGDVKF